MTIRITGLNSGLDTDSIIKELVSAYRSKGDKLKKKQTKLSWTQDKWKSLNAKVLNLYKSLDSLRFSSGYNMKKTSVSDTTKATVIAGKGAVNGTQTLRVDQIAKSGYLTGAQLKGNKKGSAATLGDLYKNSGMSGTIGAGTYRISGNGVTQDIKIDENTKISDFVSQINSSGTGVQASYDETNQRLFISSKETGKDADFTLTGLDENGQKALQALGVSVASQTSSAEAAEWIKYYNADRDIIKNQLKQDVIKVAEAKKMQEALKNDISARQSHNKELTGALSYISVVENVRAVGDLQDAGGNKISKADAHNLSFFAGMSEADRDKDYVKEADGTIRAVTSDDDLTQVTLVNGKTEYDNLKATYNFSETETKMENGQPVLDKNGQPVQQETEIFRQIKAYNTNVTAADKYAADNPTYAQEVANATDLGALRTQYTGFIEDNNTAITNESEQLAEQAEILQQYKNIDSAAITKEWADPANQGAGSDFEKYIDSLADKVEFFNNSYDKVGNDYVLKDAYASKGANKVDGQDAVITLNNAEFTSSTNTFNVNGLTIQTLAESKEEISITTATDTQGLYDKVKDFISEYNSIINEMSALYNAESARGYEPLTSEEKEALSDSDIAEWEKKVKDSLLRRDSNLSALMNSMTSAMSKSYDINGKKYSLASLGIKTGSYFNTKPANRYELHIDGDADDDTVSANADRLMSMLNSDPDTVVSIIQSAANELYDNLHDQMQTSTLRSFQSIYNDKAMAQSYSDYTRKISAWEQKVTAMEDSYYKKFAAMETALAKLQSQQSAFAGMLGS